MPEMTEGREDRSGPRGVRQSSRQSPKSTLCVGIISSKPQGIKTGCAPADRTSKPESKELTLIIACIDLCALEEKLLVPEQPGMDGRGFYHKLALWALFNACFSTSAPLTSS